MKPVQSLGHLAAVLLTFSTVASAWPNWLPHPDSLVVRQDDDSSSTKPDATITAKPTPTKTDDKSDAKTTDKKGADNTHNLNTGAVKTDDKSADKTADKTGDKTATSKTDTKTKSPSRTMFPPNDPAGNVVMVSPSLAQGLQLYKIDSKVTFAWNYTQLQGPPTAIDVLASCSAASKTFTMTQNMTFAPAATYTWDTAKQSELLTAEYTLIIYDAEVGPSATAEAGYLTTFNSFVFGLYEKKDYKSFEQGWTCAVCSAAMPGMNKGAFGLALAMSSITVLTFTWFVVGVGVL